MRREDYVVLEISSWRGISLGGTHYYGVLVGYIGDEYVREEIEKPMTEEEAKKLRKKDDFKYYVAGSITDRFDTKQEIREIALAKWQTIFPNAKALLEGQSADAEPMKVLWVKNPEYMDELNEIWEVNEQIPHIRVNYKKIDELCDEFNALLEKAIR